MEIPAKVQAQIHELLRASEELGFWRGVQEFADQPGKLLLDQCNESREKLTHEIAALKTALGI